MDQDIILDRYNYLARLAKELKKIHLEPLYKEMQELKKQPGDDINKDNDPAEGW